MEFKPPSPSPSPSPSPAAGDEDATRREQQQQHPREDAPAGFVPPMSAADVAAVESLLGYEFADKSLVGQALTHGSFYYPYRPGDATYERLEYLGDGVLTCLMSREVFLAYRDLPPGPLTRLRAANVDKEKLARVAVDHGIHRFLRHKAPQLDGQIDDFIKELCEYQYHSNGLLDAPKVLSDIVESLIGAIYLDSNFNQEVVWRVFRNLADPLISLETLGRHPVSELLEFCQKNRRGLKIVKDGWDKNLKVDVLVDGELVGSAVYGQKKEIAQNRAAKAALDKLKETLGQCSVESATGEVHVPLDRLDLAGALEI
ncbi:ribonuclease 3-like protein 3 [Lolium perenne]|uniref:ribonuclease 3-like protein 3 n=1 Tax=Lolium perenne TaxID=4522 RepID=UPI0021F50753|nr:ribonuclease 3-like protein 3 [Lolium perenne]